MDYSSLIKNNKNIYAHVCNKENRKETLIEHTKNVLETFNYLDKEYKILNKLNNSFKDITITKDSKVFHLSNGSLELLKEMFVNAIGMHDLGKINPKFQSEKLSNNISVIVDKKDSLKLNNFVKNPIVETYHSPMSTMLYLDYFIKEINKKIKGDEKIFLIYILFCFSNTIKSHHGELKDTSLKLNKAELKKYISHMDIFKEYLHFYNNSFDLKENYGAIFEKIEKYDFDTMTVYIWTKLLYSLLVSCDFISTYSFYKNKKVSDFTLNNKIDLNAMQGQMEGYFVSKGIEEYKKDKDYFKKNGLPLINELRSDIAIESVENIIRSKYKQMFMIESPTGSGKTFNSVNCALKLLDDRTKLIYAFPVNTLSTQTKATLDSIFNGTIDIQEVNSISALPVNNFGNIDYQKVLLDRQLLNYQGVVTSNVALFNWMFSNKRESSMSLFSLFDSVIILDEIQNYKNSIWKETIEFLYKYSKIMGFKLIMMSATLPDLQELIGFEKEDFTKLISDPSVYYNNPLFKDRVHIDNSLLKESIDNEYLLNHMIKEVDKRNKIEKGYSKCIIEFITKKSCREFNEYALSTLKDYVIYHLDGDTNSFTKEMIINDLKNKAFNKNVLLCTTQVVEAGVDIDMDLGYKDAVFPDVDEQFLGRINRSASKANCFAFFFNKDSEDFVYKGDYRLYSNISNPKYFNCLITKDFKPLYQDYVFKKIDKIKSKPVLSIYKEFMDITVKLQDFEEVSNTMQLIDNQTFNVFIPSVVNGIDGEDVWEQYMDILLGEDYSKRRVDLVNIRKYMSYFTYSVYGLGLQDETPIGSLYYIKNGSNYIKNDKFDSETFKECYKIIKK